MKIKTEDLYSELQELIAKHKNKAEDLKDESIEMLNERPAEGSWNVFECLEHLNLYGDFYLPEIEKQIKDSKYSTPSEYFKPGMMGNYFAKSMLPKEKLNKMKTFKDKDPIGELLDKSHIHRFISQQRKFIDLLNASKSVDLNKTKTGISISSVIRLKLGDTFRFVLYHQERHMEQIERILRAWKMEDRG